MKVQNFWELISAQWDKGNFVCVGLDSDLEKIPEATQVSATDDPHSSGYDFAQAARRETEKLRDLVNQCRLALPKPVA